VSVKLQSNFGDPDIVAPFSDPPLGIICPAGLQPGADFNAQSYGSGPYTLVSATHLASVNVTLRPAWKWGPNGATAATLPKALEFKYVANDTTAANLLTTGGLDLASIVGPDITRLSNDKTLIRKVAHTVMTGVLVMNPTVAHLTADKAVRQALATVIDRAAWNQAANNGFGLVGTSVIASDVQCYDPTTAAKMPVVDVAKAQTVLKNAGYTLGSDGKFQKDGKPLTLLLIATTDQSVGPQYLQDQFSKLGMTVTLKQTDKGTFNTTFVKGDWDIGTWQVSNPNPDPALNVGFFSGPSPPNGTNYARVTNSVVDQALNAAKSASGDQRCKYWATAQQAILDNYDMWPLASQSQVWFSRGVGFRPATGWLDVTQIT
jgi:peptide/nickel transport system substrate-binding protein